MALPREASSLSSITHLAENPPRFPRNPVEGRRASLVLYIARVPGSRDIILMTMKPRLKNVTAEDVLNCLYYLHVDMPDDYLLESQPSASHVVVNQAPPQVSNTRKLLQEKSSPLATSETATFSRDNGPVEANTLLKVEVPQQPLKAPPEIPLWASPLPERPLWEQQPSPVRRPLGPRALHSQPKLSQTPFPGRENVPLRNSILPSDGKPQVNIAPSRSQNFNLDSSLTGLKSTNEFPTPMSNHSRLSREEPLSITFIRRDPASGAQWNIGIIQCHSHLHSQSSNLEKCSVVSVRLTASGYGQFRSPQETADKVDTVKDSRLTASQSGFDRQIRMDWSDQFSGKLKLHRRGTSDPSNNRQVGQTNDSKPIPDPSNGLDCGFISPWNGRCEFSSGSGGRILKCKHILPTHIAVASDTKAAVSELRFNLPSNVYSGGNKQNSGRSFISSTQHTRGKSSFDSFTSSRPSRPDPTSYAAMYPSEDEGDDDDDDLEEGFDALSLGREKAGGGIRGKRVKLGKLIVHDEGLKMLDLVVAANMGIWWTVWDG